MESQVTTWQNVLLVGSPVSCQLTPREFTVAFKASNRLLDAYNQVDLFIARYMLL